MPRAAMMARTVGNLGLIESMRGPEKAVADIKRSTGYQTVSFKWQYSVPGYSAVPIPVVAFRIN
jgi:hypothetical protein